MQCFSFLFAFVILTVANCDNGSEVNIRQFPYQVSVQFEGKHICGGAILSKTTIITAAHCVQGRRHIHIHYASSYIRSQYTGSVLKIIIHPGYNSTTLANDLALVKVVPAMNSRKIQTVELAQERLPDNAPVTIVGWNTIDQQKNSLGKILQAVTVQTLNQAECAKDYPGEDINGNVMCATATGKDFCEGYFGGALVAKDTNLIVGIFSRGYGCEGANNPGIYTSIPESTQFIEENLSSYGEFFFQKKD